MHTDSDVLGVAIAGGLMVIFVMALVRWVAGLFQRNPEPIIDVDTPHFEHVKAAKKQLPDGSWVGAKIEWEPCAPPLAPNDTEPHFPADREHRKSCARCQQEYARAIRMPHASN